MDIEKIVYLVAIAVYGILSTVLSIVRTLKTSKISSEVKAVLPSVDDGRLIDGVQPVEDVHPIEDGQTIDNDDGKPLDDVQDITLEEVLSIISQVLNRRR